MEKEKDNNKWIIGLIPSVVILTIVCILLFSQGSPFYVHLEFVGHGHNYGGHNYAQTGTEALLQSLSIGQDYDIVYDVDGDGVEEELCVEPTCWEEVDRTYELCIAGEIDADGEYVMPMLYTPTDIIIPRLIADEVDYDCEDMYLWDLGECFQECREETYVWNGAPITDITTFFDTNYPRFSSRFETGCEWWLTDWTGTAEFVGTSNEFSCTNSMIVSCTSETSESFQNVCEAIGGTYDCDTEPIFWFFTLGQQSCSLGGI